MAPNIILFSIILGCIVAVIEVYVLAHFTSFIRRSKYSPWFYRVAWSISVVMMALYWYIVYRRHFFRMDGIDVFLFGLVCFWSVPKLFITVPLLVRDLVYCIRFLARKIRSLVVRSTPPASTSEQASLAGRQVATPTSERRLIAAEARSIAAGERRAFLARAGWTLTAVPYVIVGKGIWQTLYDFQVYREEIRLPNLPKSMDGFRIVQISDIHSGSFPDRKPFREVCRIVTSLRPDAVVITGDFVNAQPNEMRTVSTELADLCKQLPVYASLGNHDHYHTVAEHATLVKGVRQLGVDLLINEHRRIGSGSNTFVLAGTDNTGFKQEFAQLDKALVKTSAEDAIVLMAHDPTFWDKEVVGTNVGLMLAGHTHGGQFGVQFGNFEWSPASMVYKQSAGRYSKGNQILYVNRGIGTVGPPMRIGIPPEITEIVLRSA